jgi:junctophilin
LDIHIIFYIRLFLGYGNSPMKQSSIVNNNNQYNITQLSPQNAISQANATRNSYYNDSQMKQSNNEQKIISQEPEPDIYRRNSNIQQYPPASRPFDNRLATGKPESSIDHLDHYKRPPSRDSSVDRYTRATTRFEGSRQPSLDRNVLSALDTDKPIRSGSLVRNSLTTGK